MTDVRLRDLERQWRLSGLVHKLKADAPTTMLLR